MVVFAFWWCHLSFRWYHFNHGSFGISTSTYLLYSSFQFHQRCLGRSRTRVSRPFEDTYQLSNCRHSNAISVKYTVRSRLDFRDFNKYKLDTWHVSQKEIDLQASILQSDVPRYLLYLTFITLLYTLFIWDHSSVSLKTINQLLCHVHHPTIQNNQKRHMFIRPLHAFRLIPANNCFKISHSFYPAPSLEVNVPAPLSSPSPTDSTKPKSKPRRNKTPQPSQGSRIQTHVSFLNHKPSHAHPYRHTWRERYSLLLHSVTAAAYKWIPAFLTLPAAVACIYYLHACMSTALM